MTEKKAYNDLFPGAELKITPKQMKSESDVVGPLKIRLLIEYLFNAGPYPKWITVSHAPLAKYVYVVEFNGLISSIYEKHKDKLPTFLSISNDKFPITTIASQKKGIFTPSHQTLLGIIKQPKRKYNFQTYEEMTATLEDLTDNGFPLRNPYPLTHKPRYETFKLEILTEDDLSYYEELPDHFDGALDYIAIDCEMIETNLGIECARVSGTVEDGTVIFDEIFKPLGDVIDLRTEISGITQEKLDNAEHTSYEVVKTLSKYISKDTCIIGHSLENDFRSMKLIHTKVIDTSIIYNKDCKYPYKPKLSKIYTKYIKKPFQVVGLAHDSIDDARATFELVKYAKEQAVHEKIDPPRLPELFSKLKSLVTQITYFSENEPINFAGLDPRVGCTIKTDTDSLVSDFLQSITDRTPFSVLHLNELEQDIYEEERELSICMKYDGYLQRIINTIPPLTVLIIFTGSGCRKALQPKDGLPEHLNPGRDPERKEAYNDCCRGLTWIHCVNESKPDQM